MKLNFWLIAILTVVLTSCKSDKVQPEIPLSNDCPTVISYSQEIEPLIQTNCSTSGCHNTAGPGKPKLMDYFDISSNASNILSVIRHDGPGTPMPLGQPKLADSVIQQFSCWIDQGLLDN